MIAHILLLPHPEHRERLLAPGAPLWTGRDPERETWPTGKHARDDGAPDPWGEFGWAVPGRACWDISSDAPLLVDAHLVLARDGAVVDEGSDRLARVLAGLPLGPTARIHAAALGLEIAVLLGREPGMDPAVALERLRSIVAPLGTLVLIDADGREVAP